MPESECYLISNLAYTKLVMHSLKYHYSSVSGFLLAKKQSKTGAASSSSSSSASTATTTSTTTISTSGGKEDVSSSRTEFVDVIPLFHLGHGLVPMNELALLQVSAYCKQRNLIIAGLYYADRYFHDSAPDVFSQRIAEKIYEQNNSAVLLVLDNMGLASATQQPAEADSVFSLHLFNEGKWKQRNGLLKLQNPALAFQCLNELILNQGLQYYLKDFDNHLDKISDDWENKAINQKILKFTSQTGTSVQDCSEGEA